MKALTAAEMREVDRRTIEMGIPGIVLMENAGHRVVEFLERTFAPLAAQRIAILCGKGNNGGDGLVIARQLYTRFPPAELHVVLLAAPEDLKGEAAENLRMLKACGCPLEREITEGARRATLVIDALLGTGISGPPAGRMLEGIRALATQFPLARLVAVDMPSGLDSDTGTSPGEHVRADYTVTFTAPKLGQVLPPNCDAVGKLIVGAIGSPPPLYEHVSTAVTQPCGFLRLLAPRQPGGHKGDYGHVLVIAGSRGKTGAAAMAGMAALRAGAGLVTVASAESAISAIASHAPEIMTAPLPETAEGGISQRAFDYGRLAGIVKGKDVIALGPGLGVEAETVDVARRAVREFEQPMVIDADALNALAGGIPDCGGRFRVLTPHPGEMARLTAKSAKEIQAGRLAAAREFAAQHGVCLLLKGQRTVIAFPGGGTWINPTGTPAMGTGGTGDILTGLIAGMLSQFPGDREAAILAAVYLHGLSGELAAAELGEKPVIATDLLGYLPGALEECARFPHRL